METGAQHQDGQLEPIDVLTMGEVMTLMLAEPGTRLGGSSRYDHLYAGAESNVAVGIARLGHTVRFVTRLGDDAMGHRILHELRGEGIAVDSIALDPHRPTGLVIRDAAWTGISVNYHRAGSAATALSGSDIPHLASGTAKVLHLTGVTAAISETAREACLVVVQRARAAGIAVSFDPNVRLRLASPQHWREIVDQFAALATILMIGGEDAAAIGVDDPIEWGHRKGVEIVVFKDGSRGAIESSNGQRWQQSALAVPVVDPVGAGDAFAAGWLSGWLRGLAPADRLAEAAAVAACVVASRGDVPGLPDPAMRDRMLAGVEAVAR